MKVAYFSPFPPKKTGIATYSKNFVSELGSLVELELFDTENSNCFERPIHGFLANPQSLEYARDCDTRLYHIGNNPFYHQHIANLVKLYPGWVVLHDTVLYYLHAIRGKGGLMREIQACSSNPSKDLYSTLNFLSYLNEEEVLSYKSPENFPLIKDLLKNVLGVIVHSETAAKAVKHNGFKGTVRVINLPYYPKEMIKLSASEVSLEKEKLGLSKQVMLLGCFGFLASTKRIDSILEASKILLNQGIKIKILFVGTGENYKEKITDTNLLQNCIFKEFVDDQNFQKYLSVTDLILNLRYPSMGESSATLFQSLAYGKPCIITDFGSFSEVPDNIVIKVTHGENEIKEIKDAIRICYEDQNFRKNLGNKAQEFVKRNNHPQKIALQYKEALFPVE